MLIWKTTLKIFSQRKKEKKKKERLMWKRAPYVPPSMACT